MTRLALRSTLVAQVVGAATIAAGAERVVTLSVADGPRPVTIEWRALAPTGTRLVAVREVTLQGRVPVTVPDGRSVLRVVEAGSAPRSFVVLADAVDVAFVLGPRARGGEILGRLVTRRYRPVSLRLSGPSKRELLVDEDGFFQQGPLPPGAYDVTPVYRGGIAAEELYSVSVADGRTAELLPLELPATGAARIDLGDALCAEAGVSLVLTNVRTYTSRPLPWSPQGVCAREVEGLAPGEWRMSATTGGDRNEPCGEAAFAIAADEATDVAVRAFARVAGAVTVGGEPAVGLQLRFEHGVRQWHVATDALGRYEVVLGEPGEYAVAVGGGDLPARTFQRSYASGEQREDVELAAGAIAVVVRAEPGAAKDETVDLGLLAQDGRRRAGRVQLPGGSGAFAGLDLGAYTVTASTASGLRSRDPARVELTASAPSAEVELVLERGGGVLRVVGADGSALAGASATVAGRALPERAPGVFALDGVPAGERLTAQAPGHAAACRVLDGSVREMAVPLLLPSDVLELSLRPDAPWRDSLLIGLPGSDCPVAIDDVEPQVRVEEHGVTISLRLPRGSFSLALGGQAHPVSVPGKVEIP